MGEEGQGEAVVGEVVGDPHLGAWQVEEEERRTWWEEEGEQAGRGRQWGRKRGEEGRVGCQSQGEVVGHQSQRGEEEEEGQGEGRG